MCNEKGYKFRHKDYPLKLSRPRPEQYLVRILLLLTGRLQQQEHQLPHPEVPLFFQIRQWSGSAALYKYCQILSGQKDLLRVLCS